MHNESFEHRKSLLKESYKDTILGPDHSEEATPALLSDFLKPAQTLSSKRFIYSTAMQSQVDNHHTIKRSDLPKHHDPRSTSAHNTITPNLPPSAPSHPPLHSHIGIVHPQQSIPQLLRATAENKLKNESALIACSTTNDLHYQTTEELANQVSRFAVSDR
jgi:hypothetical protein